MSRHRCPSLLTNYGICTRDPASCRHPYRVIPTIASVNPNLEPGQPCVFLLNIHLLGLRELEVESVVENPSLLIFDSFT